MPRVNEKRDGVVDIELLLVCLEVVEGIAVESSKDLDGALDAAAVSPEVNQVDHQQDRHLNQ